MSNFLNNFSKDNYNQTTDENIPIREESKEERK